MPLTRLTWLWRSAVLLLGLFGCASVHALCTLACSCTVSTTSVAFGAHNPLLAANNDSTGNVRVACGGVVGLSIPFTIAVAAGTSGTMSARQMASGAARLNYNIYTSGARTTVWGDGSGATATVAGSILLDLFGSSPPQDFPVHGRIPGSQGGVAPGSYADALVVTLTWF